MRRRYLVTIGLLVSLASSAAGQRFRIQGKVEEFGLAAGLDGVEIQLEKYESKPLSSFTPKSTVGTATTTSAGAFAFEFTEAGTYRVTVSKEGFLLPGTPLNGFSRSAEFDLTPESPEMKLVFQLARPAQLSGTVLDLDTRKPVEGLSVSSGQFTFNVGRPYLFPSGVMATTGPDGRFVLPGLVPGEHVVQVGTRMRASFDLRDRPDLKKLGIEDRFLATYTDADSEAVDEDYDPTHWPGGTSLANASPITVPSSAQLDLGTLGVRKVSKYRVAVSVSGAGCKSAGKAAISVKSITHLIVFATPILGSIPCGGSALLRGFAPGEYELEAVANQSQNKSSLTSAVKLQVGHGPTSAQILFAPPLEFNGSAQIAEGAKPPDWKSIRLSLQPTGYGASRHGLIPIDSAGQFRIENVSSREYRFRVSGIPETHYLQQLLYNGLPAPGFLFTPNPAAPEHSLVLILDDKPATVTGTVSSGGNPAPQAHVLLAPWPAPEDVELFTSSRSATADAKGNFSIAGLAPGEYRVLAVAPEAKPSLQKPGELLRLLSNAETVTLTKRQLKSLRLGL